MRGGIRRVEISAIYGKIWRYFVDCEIGCGFVRYFSHQFTNRKGVGHEHVSFLFHLL